MPVRGHNFVAPVSRDPAPRDTPSSPVAASGPHNLSFAVTRMIGRRKEFVAVLVSRLSRVGHICGCVGTEKSQDRSRVIGCHTKIVGRRIPLSRSQAAARHWALPRSNPVGQYSA